MPLTIDELCDRLTASKLLSADDARSALLSVAENERPSDGESLAALLVKSGKLTAFQAKRICEGKGDKLTLGNYVILDQLGQGGMGAVFKAQHRRMKRTVALKVVRPEILDSPTAIKRFQREVETVAKLDHPNIVIAHDSDEAEGLCFLVMQFVDGRDLASVVKRDGPLTVEQAVDCVLQTARGLAYAHEQGIIHRDIKPSNLLVDRKGTVKILDLGLATLISREGAHEDSLTGSDMIVGTVDYMAPEQAQSARLVDARSDIYSLGITLWYLLTGRVAYGGESVVEKLLAHQQNPLPSLVGPTSGLPDSPVTKDLDTIFQRMAAKRPADRYQSMGEVVSALEAFQRTHRPGSTEATVQWSGGSAGGNLTQRRGGAEAKGEVGVAVDGAADHGLATDEHTGSILRSDEDTTANRKRPELPVIVSATKRRGRRATWRQYSLIGISATLFLVAAIGSPLLMLKLSTPTGSIVVTTDQPEIEGAHVSLDGQAKFQVGRSGPQKAIRLAADDQHHTLFVTKEGFQPYSRQIRVGDSAPQRVFVHLSPIAKPVIAPAPAQTAKSVATASASPQPKAPNAPSGGFALEFNGKDSYVDLPTLRYDGSHPITLEAMVSAYQANERATIVGDEGTGGMLLNFCVGGEGRKTSHGCFVVDDTVSWANVLSREPMPLHRRMHISAILDGSSITFYLDGILQEHGRLKGAFRPAVDALRIGARPQNINPFFGVIDELRVSKVARYSADFTPPTRFEPDKDTLALYHFDDGAGEVLTDSSGNNHHGKIVNAKWVPGIAGGPPPPPPTGYALEFNGKDSYVDLPTLRYDGSHPITLEATIMTNQIETNGGVIQNKGIWLANGVAAGNKREFGRFTVANPVGWCTAWTRQRLTPRLRVHVAGVLEALSARLYIDGKLQEAAELSGKYQGPSDEFCIGGVHFRDEAAVRQSFSGIIDEVRISKIARYTADFTPPTRFEPDKDTLALYHFDEGQGDVLTDSSGNNHHGKIVNAKWVPGIAGGPPPPPPPPAGFALEFNGKDSYVDLPTLKYDGSHSITVEATITSYESNMTGTIIGDAHWPDGLALHCPWSSDSPRLTGFCRFIIGDTAGYRTARTQGASLHRKAVHIAGALDNAVASLFVDGKLQATSLLRDSYRPGRTQFRIGTQDPPPNSPQTTASLGWLPFFGLIDEVRVSKVARYSTDFTPPTRLESDKDTLALYHFDEGQGDVLTDSSGNNHHGKIVNAKWVNGLAAGPPIPNPKSDISNPQSASPCFALEFNGKDSYVDLPTLRYDGSHPITLEATIVTGQLKEYGTVVGDAHAPGGDENAGMMLYFPGPNHGANADRGQFTVAINNDADYWRSVYTVEPIAPATRLHAAAVLDGRTIWLFKQGVPQQRFELPDSYKASPNSFMIGAHPTGRRKAALRGGESFFGTIDELRISKVARYSSDFAPPTRFEPDNDTLALYHFDEGQGEVLTDFSGNNHHGKIVNAKWVPGIAGGPQ